MSQLAQELPEAASSAEDVTSIFVIWNPEAGQQGENEVPQMIEEYFSDQRWHYEIHETEEDESLAKTVQQAIDDGYDWIFAAGGDGTLSAVADGLVNTAVPLGIIPVGTANSLAQALDIPLEIEGACELLAGETAVRTIDALQVDDHVYLIQLGTGLDSRVMENTTRDLKNKLGPLAYVWSIIKKAVGWQPHHFWITVDGVKHNVKAAEVMVTNGAKVGVMSLEWREDIELDDGQIDVVVLNARSLWDYIKVLGSMVRGEQKQVREIRYFTAVDAITIVSERSLPVQGDGEIIGETPIHAKVLKQAVNILVKRSKEA